MELDKNFIKNNIEKLGRKYDTRNVFEDFVACCALSLSNLAQYNQDRENEYLRIVKKYDKEEVISFSQMLAALQIELLKDNPEDVLGNIYESFGFYSKDKGQFFTPIPVSDFISKIMIGKDGAKNHIKEKGYISILDPCCGSGRLLFSSLQSYKDAGIDINDIYIEGSDISNICCYMTYVNLSLMGANAIIQNKDALTNKVYDTYFTPALANNKKLIDNLLRDGILVKEDQEQDKEEDYEQ